MKTGIELISEERQRQIDVEGWTPEHDDSHSANELAQAAVCYIETACEHDIGADATWPWDAEWFKPSKNRVRNLQKAGALIAAEIDRLNRITPPQ